MKLKVTLYTSLQVAAHQLVNQLGDSEKNVQLHNDTAQNINQKKNANQNYKKCYVDFCCTTAVRKSYLLEVFPEQFNIPRLCKVHDGFIWSLTVTTYPPTSLCTMHSLRERSINPQNPSPRAYVSVNSIMGNKLHAHQPIRLFQVSKHIYTKLQDNIYFHWMQLYQLCTCTVCLKFILLSYMQIHLWHHVRPPGIQMLNPNSNKIK